MALGPVRAALEHGLVPLVFGDVAVDEVRGGTIVSTEDVFGFLARALRPRRLLLAGLEPGVLTHFPGGEVISLITPHTPLAGVGASGAVDVTGGMANKVTEMLMLVQDVPGLEARVFSGLEPGQVRRALLAEGEPPGTRIAAGIA
jgi:isopentenyl phosphate kinase